MNAASTFAAISDNSLAGGFAVLAKGAGDVATRAVALEEDRRNLVNQRWDALAAHQKMLEQFHTTKGHPLNFSDRAARVLTLLRQDFSDAARRTVAAQMGLAQVYAASLDFSWQASDTPIEALVLTVRNLLRELQRSKDADVIINLYAWSDLRANSFAINPISRLDTLDAGTKTRVNTGGFRIKAIGAKLRLKSMHGIDPDDRVALTKQQNMQLLTASVTIIPGDRLPFDIPHVGVFTPDTNAYYQGGSIQNFPLWAEGPLRWNLDNWSCYVNSFEHPDSELENSERDNIASIPELHFVIAGTRSMPRFTSWDAQAFVKS